MNIAGIAMLHMDRIIDNIIGKINVGIFDFLGFDIHTSLFSTGFYGGSRGIIANLILISFVKVLLPLIYLHKTLNCLSGSNT